MTERILPGIGLTGFWDQGAPWKVGGDQNWLKSSVLTQLAVKSATTPLPASPLNGVIYIVPAADTNGNQIAARDNGAWVYLPPQEGWIAYVRDTGVLMSFDGTTWAPILADDDGATLIGTPEGTVQDALDARAKTADLAADSGSAVIGFIQSGTGAVGRSQQSKSRDFVSADDFGVPANGVSDSAPAVQAMLNAHAGKSVVLLPRTYKFLSGITVPAGTEIHAWGATLDFSASHMTGLAFQDGGAIIGAKRIFGAGNSSYNASGRAIACEGVSNAPAAPTYVAGPKVLYCGIDSWGAYGVYLKYCSNPLVELNNFSHVGYAAVQGLSCTGGRADKNTIYDVSPGTSGNAYGISWTKGPGTLIADPVSLTCTGNENIIDSIPVWEGLDTHGGEEITFRGNKISNCKTSISATFAPVSGGSPTACKKITIAENIISGGSTGAAIRVAGSITGGVVDAYVEDTLIQGNRILNGGIPNTVNGAILLQATKNLTAAANTLQAPLLCGILLISDNLDFNIIGGTIVDPWDNTSAAVACIYQSGNNNTGYIGGVTFAFRDAGLGTNVANGSIRFTSAMTGNEINVGRNSYTGITTGKLAFANSGLAGVNVSQSFSESGSAVIAVTNAGTSALIDVTFSRQFPVAPQIKTSLSEPANGGGKLPVVTITNKTVNGFRIIIRPYDLTSWSASGNVSVEWVAST